MADVDGWCDAVTTGLEGLATPQWDPPPGLYTQYPTEVLDYAIDWSDFLPDGDRIVESGWTADTGLNIGQFAFTDASTTLWVSGGEAGFLYRVTNTISTAGGRQSVRVLHFKIKHAC